MSGVVVLHFQYNGYQRKRIETGLTSLGGQEQLLGCCECGNEPSDSINPYPANVDNIASYYQC